MGALDTLHLWRSHWLRAPLYITRLLIACIGLMAMALFFPLVALLVWVLPSFRRLLDDADS